MLAIGILVLFLALVLFGLPVFAAMGVSGLLGMVLIGESANLAQTAALTISRAFTGFVLVAVPLYILVGTLMEQAGFSDRLFDFAKKWVGQLSGGLGVATVAACALFAAISGSSVATVATIGLVSFPALTSAGYDRDFSGALIASGGTLGILIPPSIAMILYGVIAEQSISALFMAGIVPGIILSLMMAIYTAFVARKFKAAERFTLKDRLRATYKAGWVIMLPVFILAGIYSGFATPTEAAALAVAYVLTLGLMTKALDWTKIKTATFKAVSTTVMIFMLLGFGRYLTEFFTLSGLPDAIVHLVTEFGLSKMAVIFAMIVLFLVLGTVLEAMSMMLIAVPILFPITQAVGINPLAFGVFVVLAIEAAQITPPIGINIFTVASIGKIDIRRIAIQIGPFLLMIVALMLAVVLIEPLATWLPGTMK
ncbi:TRAP transporter large permease [Roseibium sp. M-1]